MNWTKSDINKLALSHNLENNKKLSRSKTIKIPKIEKLSIEKETIKKLLWYLNREGLIPEYIEELQFDNIRKFRFDWAIPDKMIAIEYEGVFSKKSRHTTITGYTNDCTKYNLALRNGWRVLRYTAKNYHMLEDDLKNLIKK